MWSRENVVLYPLLCTAAGFGSGCFGIGGGTITGPLMLALDMHPQVVAATASFMILFTSSLTTTQFLIVGSLNLQYGAWCSPLPFPSVVYIHSLASKVLFLGPLRWCHWPVVRHVLFTQQSHASIVTACQGHRLGAPQMAEAIRYYSGSPIFLGN
jgi:hypothetical protein